jgi:hypothetical protein
MLTNVYLYFSQWQECISELTHSHLYFKNPRRRKEFHSIGIPISFSTTFVEVCGASRRFGRSVLSWRGNKKNNRYIDAEAKEAY